MALPNFPSNAQGERVDALITAGNAPAYKLGVGTVPPAGGSLNASWAGVATHVSGSAVGVSDGVVVVAGEHAGNTMPLAVGSTGGLVLDSGSLVIGGTVAVSGVAGTVTVEGTATVDGTVAVSGVAGTVYVEGAVDVGSVAGTVYVEGTVDVGSVVDVSPSPSTRETYVAAASVAATAATEVITIEAPAGSAVRLTRLLILNVGTQTTSGWVTLQLLRTTTAGTDGTITPAPLDTADTYGGIVRSAPTPGTESTVLYPIPVWVPDTAANMAPIVIDWDGPRMAKAPTVPAGTAHGIALVHPGSAGAADLAVAIEFVVG